MTDDTIFYVGVPGPEDFRKDILESTKDVIHLLQEHEKLKRIRIDKVEESTKLRKIIKELILLNNKLKGQLPKTKLRNLPKMEISESRMEHPKREQRQNQTKQAQKSKDDLEKLEDELSFIEGKLKEIR